VIVKLVTILLIDQPVQVMNIMIGTWLFLQVNMQMIMIIWHCQNFILCQPYLIVNPNTYCYRDCSMSPSDNCATNNDRSDNSDLEEDNNSTTVYLSYSLSSFLVHISVSL